ncbi:hypothetical protein SteCoe_3952 [Stentor coeruleus]|uniref:cGMP-dependent protein kinase n=1 Tax=Stentor coeruleus TaxID=5963 RepID=A0A1R2CVU4_9CILI|nr:hypothetical protein SteCoe_3952 [Stentor coeruleus]
MGSCVNKFQGRNVILNEINLPSPKNEILDESSNIISITRKVSKHKAPVIDSRLLSEVYIEASTAQILEVPKNPKEIDIIRHSLAKHFIFRNLKENYASVIIHHMRLYNLKSNEIIFEQGRPGTNFYVVSKGKLEIIINSTRVKILSTGDSFGEMALLHDTPRTATITTMTACSLWCLDRKTFRSTLEALELINYEENKKFIDSISVFQTLNISQKETLVHCLTTHTFNPGSVIVNEGDPGDLLYIIKEGMVLVTKNNQEVRRMGKGFYFGEQALLYVSPRTASVTAVDCVKCLAISGKELNELLGNKLQDIIYENSVRIGIEKDPLLQKLTKFQAESLIKVMKIRTFTDGDTIIPSGMPLNNNITIVVKGSLAKSRSSVLIAKVFDAINAENVIKNTKGSFDESIIAIGETTVATINRDELESRLGGSFEEITSNNDALKILRRIQIFRGLGYTAINHIIKCMKIAEYPNGAIVVEQNDPGEAFFIVKSGKAEVLKDGHNVRTITKHDYFGERSLLFNNFRSATVKAKGHLVCWVILKSQFTEILDDAIRKQFLDRIELQDDTVELEDLEIVKTLGSGMFGNVFLTVHKTKKILYALKTVDRRKIAAFEIQENIVLERKILLELDHIFIMKLVRTFKDHFRLYFLLEYIRGMDLFDVLREIGLLTESDSKFFTACLIVILEHLHERDIIYRDLKPENIVVDEEGYPKLIDFGTSKIIKGRTFTIVGTPHYMAPEVITGHGYSLSADYWSLGVLSYEFLYGKVPFGDEESDPYVIYEKIQEHTLEFPRWSDRKSKSKEFISQILSVNPAKRFGGGFDTMKLHSWFQGLDWDKLLSKQLKPPFIPKIKNNKVEVDNALKIPKEFQETIAQVEAKDEIPPPRRKASRVPADWDEEF